MWPDPATKKPCGHSWHLKPKMTEQAKKHKSDRNFSVFSHSCKSVQSSNVIQHLASKHQSVTDAKVIAGRRQETGFAHAASTDVRTGIRKLLSDAPNTKALKHVMQALTTVELDEELDVFDEDKARRDAINGFENVWTNWQELAATIDWGIQDWVKDLPLWKTVDAENVTKNSRGIPQYPLVSLLQLDTLRMYELIISSPMCLRQYGRLPYLALAFLGRQPSNAASEGCHSTGQLVMSDKQTSMSSDTLEKVVCLRNSRSAIKVLKEIYVDEAKNVAHDITVRLSKVPLEPAVSTSGSKPAQSREAKALADDSSMFPLSDHE